MIKGLSILFIFAIVHFGYSQKLTTEKTFKPFKSKFTNLFFTESDSLLVGKYSLNSIHHFYRHYSEFHEPRKLFSNKEYKKAISFQLKFISDAEKLIAFGYGQQLAIAMREAYIDHLIFLGDIYATVGKLSEANIIYTESLRLLRQNWDEGIYSSLSWQTKTFTYLTGVSKVDQVDIGNLGISLIFLAQRFESINSFEKAEETYSFLMSIPELSGNKFKHLHFKVRYSNLLFNLGKREKSLEVLKSEEARYIRDLKFRQFDVIDEGHLNFIDVKIKHLVDQHKYSEADEFLNFCQGGARYYTGLFTKESQHFLFKKIQLNLIQQNSRESLVLLRDYLRYLKPVDKNYRYYQIDSWQLLSLKAEVYNQNDSLDLAIQNYRAALRAYYKSDSLFSITAGEKDRTSFERNFLSLKDAYVNFCFANRSKRQTLIEDLINFQINNKGKIGILSNQLVKKVYASNDSSLINLYEGWIRKRDELASIKSKPTLNDSIVSKFTREIDAEEQELSVKLYWTNSKYKGKSLVWSSISQILKEHEAAIDIVRIQNPFNSEINYAAILLTSDTLRLPKLVQIPNANQLEGRLARFYLNAITSQIVDSISYTNYWHPIQLHLDSLSIKKVYVAPDGVYNQISINSLFNPLTKKYLLEDIEVVSLTNLSRLLSEGISKKNDFSSVALFGNPDFNNSSESSTNQIAISNFDLATLSREQQRFFNGNDIADLPATKVEINELEKISKRNNLSCIKYLLKDASESNLKGVHSPSILHIATHGYFISKASESNDNWLKQLTQHDISLRSGLLLAGSGESLKHFGEILNKSEDGILSALEAANLNLYDTELVVLSACETGLGQIINGEGVYGLQRAFQMAGAKSVLISLWSVSDNATMELMTEFYQNLLIKKLSKSEALAQAQLVLKRKYQHPFYWGAFVLKE